MKDASDRVSLELVQNTFSGVPALLEALLAARSVATRLPDGREITLNKFAPMGSAVCFPVESLIFWALSVSAIRQERKCSWREARASVFVYGDDIIVREQDYTTLLSTLPRVGLKFNMQKCCTARFFRESCGCDAYVGVNVTPTRMKTVWSHRRQPSILSSYVAFSNAMQGRGYYGVADYVRKLVESVYGKIPYTDKFTTSPNGGYVSSAGLPAFVCDSGPASARNLGLKTRFSKEHRLEVFGWISVKKDEVTPLDGYVEMLRRRPLGNGISDYTRPIAERAHGGIYAQPRRNRLKRGWAVI
jgi:hypothetical protein